MEKDQSPEKRLQSFSLNPTVSPWLPKRTRPSLPDVQSPDAQSPDAQSPDAQSPDAQSPDAQSPATSSAWPSLPRHPVLQCSAPMADESHWLNQEVKNIKYCRKCHAVIPVNDGRWSHVCRDWNGLSTNGGLMFTCYVCLDEMPLDKFGAHVVLKHTGANSTTTANEVDKIWYSYFCPPCGKFMYATWEVIIRHRMTLHDGRGGYYVRDADQPQPNFDARLPWVSTFMRRLLRDFNGHSRQGCTQYACVGCDKDLVFTMSCNFCHTTDNKYFCLSCNVVFSCPRDLFEVHRYSFEHVYIAIQRAVFIAAIATGERGHGGAFA